jgi:CSLREA domain-containing protein
VAGAAALIWSELPLATASEVRQAILTTATKKSDFSGVAATGGRLDIKAALDSTVFAPRASLVSTADAVITAAGGTDNLVTVKFHDRQGIDASTIGDGDIVATRQWGPQDTVTATYVANSKVVTNGGTDVTATYRISAPGGNWDPLDFGRYVLSAVAGQVKNINGLSVPTDAFGEFSVRVSDPTVFYVNSFADAVDANVGDGSCAAASGQCTLRAAIQEANAVAPSPRTVILDEGPFSLSLPPIPESPISFSIPGDSSGCFDSAETFISSDVRSGDLDVFGQLSIFGDETNATIIDGGGLDRVFKVYAGADLSLTRLTVTGGTAAHGGGILTEGSLTLNLAAVTDSTATQNGGGIAVWSGDTHITASTISGNSATKGGGIFACNSATVNVDSSTIATNLATFSGGGLLSSSGGPFYVTNSTISQNTGGAVIGNFISNGDSGSSETDTAPRLSADNRFIVFASQATNLEHSSAANFVNVDQNLFADIFVFDRTFGTTERVSVASDGSLANGSSQYPSISADGRFVAFQSDATNLVPGDTNQSHDVFVYDRQSHTTERMSVRPNGTQGFFSSLNPVISANGRFVAFTADEPNNAFQVFHVYVYDRQNHTTENVSVANDGTQANNVSLFTTPSLSADGRFIAFTSLATNLVPGDTNQAEDIFVYDRQSHTIERVSVDSSGTQGNASSRLPSISADGRFVTFTSDATNLVPGDTNQVSDVFVYDRQSHAIERVNLSSGGAQGNAKSESPSISADGQLVSFTSDASNLVPGDTNQVTDVFVYDRQSHAIGRVSLADNGTPANSRQYAPSISADGRFVSFYSAASNLVTADTNSTQDLFYYDRQVKHMASATIEAGDPIVLESDTIAENQGTFNVSGRVESHNSLFVRNSPKLGDLISTGHNLTDRAPIGFVSSDIVNSTTGNDVGPLQDNGGPTWTHALLPGSAAIDAADPAVFPSTDGRGVVRAQDGDGNFHAVSDIGAFESYLGQIQGIVYRDQNRDGQSDVNENGVPDQFVYLDVNKNGLYDAGEPSVTTSQDDPLTAVSEAGAYTFGGLPPGTYWIGSQTAAEWPRTDLRGVDQVKSNGVEGNGVSHSSSISADGRFVAFESAASNLVPGDTNNVYDIFVYDRQSRTVERVSVASDGTQGNDSTNFSVFGSPSAPSIDASGRFVAFRSFASNLVPGDTNQAEDIFVYDRQNRTTERVNVANDGTQANASSYSEAPSISADGRFVTFESTASNLVPGDTNQARDIFVYDRQTRKTERVNVANDGTQASNSSTSFTPSISADGRFVAFRSGATNLLPPNSPFSSGILVYDRQNHTIETVSTGSYDPPSISADGRFVAFTADGAGLGVPGDTNQLPDVYVYDRQNHTYDRVNVASDGTQANAWTFEGAPSISADGRFVAFRSVASNLVPGDTNLANDVFVFDRQNRTINRVNVANDGTQANGNSNNTSYFVSLSADGRFVSFDSDATNLVADDSGAAIDVFVVANRSALGAGSRNIDLYAGQVVSNVDFGVIPDAGQISGACFDDVVANGVHDVGEPPHAGCTVFLDKNANGRLDLGETSTLSAADGSYVFANLEAEEDYRIGVIVPSGLTLVLPSANNNGIWQVHLPAGGTIADRDFGLQPTRTTGQSQNAVLQGRLYFDQSGATKPPVAGMSLFVDLNDNGVRDFDEPRTISASDGSYSFAGLGSRNYTVRVIDDPHLKQMTPIGNAFTKSSYSLAVPGNPEGSPKDVVAGDFNNDGWPDLAMPIFDQDAVSILLNDQHGGFLAAQQISLSPSGRPASQPHGSGPIALVAGDFNGQGGDDLAVVDSFSSNVAILLDFNGTQFGSGSYVNVGSTPTSMARDPGQGKVQFLVVTNDIANSTGAVKNVSILRNNGSGTFTADATKLSAGNFPAAVVTGDFNGDQLPDFAVADYGIHDNTLNAGDPGDVRVFIAQANGTYQSSIACAVGYGPAAVVAADLNGDQKLDLAVANFLTNDITICQGSGSGTFAKIAAVDGGKGPFDMTAADIDGDGDKDLLVTDATTQKIGILRNQSAGGTLALDPIESSGTALLPGVAALTLAMGDFNHDQVVDLAVANSLSKSVVVQQNKLIGGARRVPLDGVQTVAGADFAFQAINLLPRLDPIVPPSALNEDAPPITINLSGITAGTDENQPLKISVTSNNPTLIVSATPQYQSPATTGSVVLTLGADQSGQAVVTVTVTDGGLDNDLATTADNASIQQTFTLTVNPLNDLPTLDPIPTLLLVGQNPTNQLFNLNGISAGGGESQPVRITAATDNPDFIQNLTIDYTSGGSIATVHFATSQAEPNANGQIIFTVTDGGLDNNLATVGDNLSVSRSIVILVTSGTVINHAPTFIKGPDPQNITDESRLVSLSNWATGISPGNGDSLLQTVHFEVISDNTNLFTVQPAVDSSGKLTFTIKPNQIGVAHVSIVAKDDGGTASGGIDHTDPQAFTIEVTKARVWHNADVNCDVNGDTHVVADDVIAVINYINAGKPELVPNDGRADGPYYDVTGDGHLAADDVVTIINYINAHPSQAEGEFMPSAGLQTATLPPSNETLSSVDLLNLLAIDIANQPKRRT